MIPPSYALARLNRRLARLQATAAGPDEAARSAELRLHRDPDAPGRLQWSSPRARLVEMDAAEGAGGRYLGLHLSLPLHRIRGGLRLGILLHAAALPAIPLRPCLRSGLDSGLPADGFVDSFFPAPLRIPSSDGDLHTLFDTSLDPQLPETAPWRELILFLPAAGGFRLSLHHLSVIAA